MFVIAGASGRTGGVVAETLLAQGKGVRVLVRDARKGEPWRARGAEVAALSLDDTGALERALDGAAGFFTLLPEDLAAQDFHGHRRRMADAMRAAVERSRVPRVVLLSAIAACLPDGNGPGSDLHHAEKALRGAGSVVTIVRACFFQENVLAALPAALGDGVYPSFLPSADIAFPAVATRGVGRFAARCLVEPPATTEIVDLLGPAYSTRQLAEELGRALGKDLQVVDIPAARHVDVLTAAGVPGQFAEALAEMYACFASGRISPQGDRTVHDATTLAEVLPALLAATLRERGARR